MDKKVRELLKYKDENVVQFNLVNTTNQNQFVDLFNTDNLNIVPTTLNYIFPPNTSTGTFGLGTYQRLATNTSNGNLYAVVGSTTVNIFDTNNNNIPLPNLILPTPVSMLVYNSINNTFYFFDGLNGLIYVVDANTNLIITTLPYAGGISDAVFVSSKNSIYADTLLGTMEIDCVLNTITNLPLVAYTSYSYNPIVNQLYGVQSFTNTFDVIDPISNIVVQSISSALASVITTNININTPFVYVANGVTGDVSVYNWNTSYSLVTLLSPSIGVLGRGIYDSVTNNVYFGSNTGNIVAINGNNTFQTSFVALSILPNIALNQNQNSIYLASPFTNNINQVTTIGVTLSNFYISGSSNYNTFVNNLNNEPIFIQMIRLVVQNQEQLYNQIQFTKIDSNGNQLFTPEFPIVRIDTEQEQGNIATIELNDIVFDGRTYINQYQLNPLQTISVEIYYKQLDLNSASNKYPILFKPKVQLIEYIKGNK
jgi:hypothetical protein